MYNYQVDMLHSIKMSISAANQRPREDGIRCPQNVNTPACSTESSPGFSFLPRPISITIRPSRLAVCKENLTWYRARQAKRCRGRIGSALLLPTNTFAQALVINTPLFLAARQSQQKILTPAGLAHAYGLGVVLWGTLSWRGYVLCFLFLILGSAATRVGRDKKEALGIAEKRGGARGPENLWGAAGVAAVLAVCGFFAREYGAIAVEKMLLVGYTSALAAKFSDTAGSEIGKAYGTKTYELGTWKAVKAGVEGGVSVEGSVASVVGSVVAAGVGCGIGLVDGWAGFGVVSVAGVVASTLESVIGGRLQEEYGFSNELVNVVNTFVGAVVGMVLHGVRMWI